MNGSEIILTVSKSTEPQKVKVMVLIVPEQYVHNRVEICRVRRDRWLCKICASCVNFPGKQRNFSHNLRRTTRFTPAKCDFALKLLRFYTLLMQLRCFFLSKNSRNLHTFSV